MEYYEIRYDVEGNIRAMFCNLCNYSVHRLEVKATKTGHRWPAMVHNIKHHLKEKHDINLYSKKGDK